MGSSSQAVKDVTDAKLMGLDAFALNVQQPNAEWALNALRLLFDAANANGFKLFFSFDMTSLSCSSTNDAQTLKNYINQYGSKSSSMQVNGRVLVSTFAGQTCTFGGSGSLNDAWTRAVKPGDGSVPSVWFVPSFYVDPSTFSSLPVLDGAFQVSRLFASRKDGG